MYGRCRVLGGDLENLTGIENWTSSEIDCLDIKDMDYIEDEEQVPAPDLMKIATMKIVTAMIMMMNVSSELVMKAILVV